MYSPGGRSNSSHFASHIARPEPSSVRRDPGVYPLRRIADAADLANRRDPATLPRLIALLGDRDAAVRYWGAIGLGALGYNARPQYNKTTAGKLRKVGMDILVCTPEKLAECMGRIIRG